MTLNKPSSPDPVYTPGTARGAKLAALLVDEGTALIRKIFEHEVQNMNPPSLRQQLEKYRGCLYDGHKACDKKDKKHKKHFKLYDDQKKTLYPDSGVCPENTQGFDITLLECLMKELVWLELDRDAQKSKERDRLRLFRNANYGHRPRTDLSKEDFDRLWDELTYILVALGGDRTKISARLNSSIDPELAAEHFALLDRLYKEDMEVKQALGSLKEGQDSLKEGQDSLKEGQDRLEKKQDELKSLLERDNQSPGTSTRPGTESSCQTDQVPIRPPYVDDVIGCLKDLYATEYAHVRPLPWYADLDLKRHIGEVYTNLKLQCSDGMGNFQDVDTSTIASLVDIYATREGEASQVSVGPAVRKIRVEGDPGIGKSCSCQKLAYDWSCGKLDRFKVVLLLEMRNLSGKVKDAIFKQLLPEDTKINPDQLWSYIQDNQDDVLFILDGLDELSPEAREATDVVKLIQGKILRNCHVLVTSRPYHCVKDLGKCHQFYKIVGYSKENSDEFIRKYFCKSPESASKLVQQLHSNMNLSQIIVNPLCNLLICVLWEYNNKELPSSKAELYQDIVDSVAKRFCKKSNPEREFEGDQLPPDVENALRDLGKLSWEGLEKDQVQFKVNEIKKEYGTTADIMLNMGLLTRDYSFSRSILTRYCAFLHKTFQEYMAARYISGLVMDGSSREEGMKYVCHLFGMSDATAFNRLLIVSCRRKYSEVQNWLHLILGENSRPLFERFAVELKKAQTGKDREFLSFWCIMWLGTSCAGGEMAEIVAPWLSHHATNNPCTFDNADTTAEYTTGEDYEMVVIKRPASIRHTLQHHIQNPENSDFTDNNINWCVGLANVLAYQKKLPVGHGTSFIRHLTINMNAITSVLDSDRVIAVNERLRVLENALSECDTIRSVALLDIVFLTKDISFFPILTFIPRCGTKCLAIHNQAIVNLQLFSMLEKLAAISTIEHFEISSDVVTWFPGAVFSEYDRQLAHLIASHSRLRSIKLKVGAGISVNPSTRGFGNLTATLQSISKHSRLEVVKLEHSSLDNTESEIRHEKVNIEPMMRKLTECVKENKVLKTLTLGWSDENSFDDDGNSIIKMYLGDCSNQSLASLCSAIRENRTLETLVVDAMISYSKRKERIISVLLYNKPSNYKELSITLSDSTSAHGRDAMRDTTMEVGQGDM